MILHAARVPEAFACASVPLGLPALSVSIRNENVALGDDVFLSAILNVVPATPEPNTGKESLVVADVSAMFRTDVEFAYVGAISTNTACQAVIASQAGIE